VQTTYVLAVALSAAAFVSTLQAGVAFADEVLRPGNDINCTNLTSPGENADQLLSRYGSQARIEELADTESEPFDGVALYPDDPRLRIEIVPYANIRGNIAGINLTQKDSRWTIFGMKIGMTLEEATAANGEPLKLTGFWQYPDGSYSVFGDFKPGRLDGGCRLAVSLASPVPLKAGDPLYGRDEILSNDPDLMKRRPTVDGLFIVWDRPIEQ
jgi:hypothetical protein